MTDLYEFESPDSVMTLECVMECFDRATAARQMVEKDGLALADRFGQLKAHPATVIERDAKMAMLRALRALGLDIIQPGTLPIGRPAGR